MEKRKGWIIQKWHVVCGECEREQAVELEAADALHDLKNDGWRQLTEKGWVCPSCVKKEKRDGDDDA